MSTSARGWPYGERMARRVWDEQTIGEALAPVIAELGRAPRRAELEARGLGGLWGAMRRRGGVDVFVAPLVAELGPLCAQATSLEGELPARPRPRRARAPQVVRARATPTEQDVRVGAYFRFLAEGGGDPVAHWLAAERQLLVSAV